ncbi:hypothetical protein BTI64_03965 [Lactobacillus delbrueckii subsp. bulgaricus]|nr:hypothetical protein [Lactobacillus delbrueckii subsp. bulgaricus]
MFITMHKQSLALKFSFVFVVLSMAISLLTAAWQLAQGKSGSLLLVLETGAGLFLVLLPALLSKWLRFYLFTCRLFYTFSSWPLSIAPFTWEMPTTSTTSLTGTSFST